MLLRVQALRAVSPLMKTLRNEDWTHLDKASSETCDRIWSHYLRDQRVIAIRWNQGEQRFVIAR